MTASPLDFRKNIAEREISFPPALRATGKKRDLRDALFGIFMLSLDRPMPTAMQALIMHTQRQNGQAELRMVAAELEKKLSADDIAWCKETAKTLFAWTMDEGRKSAAKRLTR